MKIRTRLFLSFFFIAIFPIAIISAIFYYDIKATLINEQKTALETITKLKIDGIKSYFDASSKEIRVFDERISFQATIPIISALYTEPKNPQYQSAITLLNSQISSLTKIQTETENVLFVNPDGIISYSFTKEGLLKNFAEQFPEVGKLVMENGKKGSYQSDLFLHSIHNGSDFFEGIPFYDSSGKFIGILVTDMLTDKLFSTIHGTDGMGNTGETLLVRLISGTESDAKLKNNFNPKGDTVLFINTLRFDPNSSFKKTIKIGSQNGTAAQNAALGKTGSGIGVDYRGVQVLTIYRDLPEYNLGLVTKIDMSEILVPFYALLNKLYIALIFTLLIVIVLSIIFSNLVSSPIREITEAAIRIGKGEKNISFSKKLTSSQNEIGVLASTLANSIKELDSLNADIERKITERTADVTKKEKDIEEKFEKIATMNKMMVGRELEMVKLKQEIEKYRRSSTNT